MKELCPSNYKTLIEEIADDSKKWKDIPSSCIAKFKTVNTLMTRDVVIWFLLPECYGPETYTYIFRE